MWLTCEAERIYSLNLKLKEIQNKGKEFFNFSCRNDLGVLTIFLSSPLHVEGVEWNFHCSIGLPNVPANRLVSLEMKKSESKLFVRCMIGFIN